MALGPTFLLEVARYLGGGRGGTVDAVDAESGTTLTRQSLLASAPWWALGACATLVDPPKQLWCDRRLCDVAGHDIAVVTSPGTLMMSSSTQ